MATLFLVSAGERLSGARRSQWARRATAGVFGVDPNDPPLSVQGCAQAQGVLYTFAEVLGPACRPMLLSSPAVGCIQTALPLARSLGLTVGIDKSLTEAEDNRQAWQRAASVEECYRYFPDISLLHQGLTEGGYTPARVLNRILADGKVVICFLHAQPVMLMQQLLKREVNNSEWPSAGGILRISRHASGSCTLGPTLPSRMPPKQRMLANPPAKSNTDALIFIVRHGDRFDYEHKEWEKQISECGGHYRDPPLSATGFMQAEELSVHLASQVSGRKVRILTSPYLRTIQTALPLAQRLGSSICIEEGLAECRHGEGGPIPTARDRCRYSPEVDPEYQSNHVFTSQKEEGWPIPLMDRMRVTARILDATVGTREALVCFSHAASVAIVAALRQQILTTDLTFAPAGVYTLVRGGKAGTPWEMVHSGHSAEPFVKAGSGTTQPWGYKDRHLEKWLDETSEAFPHGYPL